MILAEADFDELTVLGIVERAQRHGVRVRLAPNTTELLVREGEYVPGSGVPLFELRPPILVGWDWAIKRAFDLLASVLLLVVGLPLWLLSRLRSSSTHVVPIFYVDRRVGVGETEFGMLKFRTMVGGAAESQALLEEANEASGALFKIRHDPRVTRVGRILRRLSLDEIPQIINVIRAEMSLVGPRPLPLRDYELLEDWHRARYLVLPGHDGALADLGTLGPLVRRPRPTRFHVPRQLVDLARHLDHRQDDPRGDQGPGRVLEHLSAVCHHAARRARRGSVDLDRA